MSVEKYRKKPVEIEAAQWDGTSFTADAIVAWSGGDVCPRCRYGVGR